MTPENLIKITPQGVVVASESEVLGMLIDEFKLLYGDDIDVSTATADGQYIYNLALMICNILNSFKTFYSNWNINTAQGVYLDNLASLTNVTRKQATKSTVSLILKNIGTEDIEVNDKIKLVDKAGITWTTETISTLKVGENTVVCECDEVGPVIAPANWIDTIELTNIQVIQNNPANVGLRMESDADFRARRNQSLAINGNTVLESLVASILNLDGIDDCKIYNNDGITNTIAKDGTSINAHSVYICIRKNPNIEIADKLIGSIIFNKMTPGITTQITPAQKLKSWSFTNAIYQTQTVHWKECQPESPSIKVTIKKLNNFSNDSIDRIISRLTTYINGLKIGEDIDYLNVRVQAQAADPMFRGINTFIVEKVEIAEKVENYKNNDTYFDMSVDDFYIETGE